MSNHEQSPVAYPPEELVKLGPGAELDRLVHSFVFKLETGKRKVPTYSLDVAKIIPAFGHIPMGMGRAQPGDSFFSSDRPYWAGHEGYDAIFTANSLALAACKAAVYIAQVLAKQEEAKQAERSDGTQ